MPSKVFGLLWALQLTFGLCWWRYQVQRRYPAADLFGVLGSRTSWVGFVTCLIGLLFVAGSFVFDWPLAWSALPVLVFSPLLLFLAGWGKPSKLTPITIRPVTGVFFTDAEQAMAVWRDREVIELVDLVYPFAVKAGMPDNHSFVGPGGPVLDRDVADLYDQKRVLFVEVTSWLQEKQITDDKFVDEASVVVEYLRLLYREGTFFQRIVLLQNVFEKLNIPARNS